MAALLGDPEVMRYYPAPKSRDEAQAWIDWNQRLYRERGFGLWAIILRATSEFAGDCGLTPQRVDGAECQLGWTSRRHDISDEHRDTAPGRRRRIGMRSLLDLSRVMAGSRPGRIRSGAKVF